MFTEFQLLRIRPTQDPLSFVSLMETKAEKLSDCGYGDIEDSIMQTRIFRGRKGRQTLQDFLFKWFQDPSTIHHPLSLRHPARST